MRKYFWILAIGLVGVSFIAAFTEDSGQTTTHTSTSTGNAQADAAIGALGK